jgi:hypothetical protein
MYARKPPAYDYHVGAMTQSVSFHFQLKFYFQYILKEMDALSTSNFSIRFRPSGIFLGKCDWLACKWLRIGANWSVGNAGANSLHIQRNAPMNWQDKSILLDICDIGCKLGHYTFCQLK